jgi:hypothetical protein
VKHTDSYFAGKVNFNRDILPQRIFDLLLGRMAGDVIELPGIMKEIVPLFAPDNEIAIEQRQFDRHYTAQGMTEPRFGRFYPKGLLKALPGIFKGNIEPFRCTGISDAAIDVLHERTAEEQGRQVLSGDTLF